MRTAVLPGYWRPLPPFGALTHPRQAQWLARQWDEVEGRAEPEGIGRFDAELGWAYRPGSQASEGLYTVHPDGWRGPRDYAKTVPNGITRLATFGESFTFCHEVGDGETFQSQLEALEPRYELPNFGVGGYGTDQALLVARQKLPGLDADVALIGVMLENIGRNVTRYRPLWVPQSESPVAKPRFVLREEGLEYVPLPFRERVDFLRAIQSGAVLEILKEHEYWNDQPVPSWLAWSATARLLLGPRAYRRRWIPDLWRHPSEPFHTTMALLESFRELAREHTGRDVVVLIFPAQPDLKRLLTSGDKYWTTLIDELERRDMPHIDFSEALFEAAQTVPPASLYGPGHLSRRGNAVVAETLRDWLANWL